MTFKMSSDKKFIEMDSVAPSDKSYDDLQEYCLSLLPAKDGGGKAQARFCLIDLEVSYEKEGTTFTKSKLVFISWIPDNCPIKEKMLYASSKEAIKRVLIGVPVHVHCTDPDDLDYDDVILPEFMKFA